MELGTLLRFHEDRGFGFISPDAGGDDLFMHVADLSDPKDQYRLSPGTTRVQFSRGMSSKGPKASRVSIVAAEPAGEYEEGEPAQPTEEAWRELLEEGLRAIMDKARSMGWVS